MQSSRQYLLIWSREEQVSYIAIDCNQLGYQQWEFFRKSMTKTLQLYSKLIINSNTSGFKDADLPVVFVFCFEQVSLTMCWEIPEFSLPGRWKGVPLISRKCYNPIKTSFLAVVIVAPVPVPLLQYHSFCTPCTHRPC